ncbi:MAG: AAA family ATPase [Vulcanisaeta sp.]|nr:AAA family ATPase [Vulcanisaeta sp.]MCG2892569.1 AAA family ATPase [Vulcanisaeta sp.]MCG2894946.1 AAA family ATPase [Vulcanisaeta sp.]
MAGKEAPTIKVFPEEITIENFKSIRHLTLKPKPGVNVLVGPNMAGKTNILEALHFLSRALSQAELLKTPYLPYLPQYWSPEDLFFMRRVENPIGFEILFRVVMMRGEVFFKHYVRFAVKFALSRGRETIEPSYMLIAWETVDKEFTTKLEVGDGEVRVCINPRYVSEYAKFIKEVRAREDVFKPFIDKIINKINELSKKSTDLETKGELVIAQRAIESQFLRSFLIAPFIPIFPIPPVSLGNGFDEFYLIGTAFPITFMPILIRWGLADAGEFRGVLYDTAIAPPGLSTLSSSTIRIFLERSVLLKHPDIGAIFEPQLFTGEERLDVRARNLPQVFYRLSAEGRTEYISIVLREAFGGVTVEPRSSAGRVFLVIRERGIELPPPNIADGLIKALAIASAIELRPTMLLIDEVENSLHVKALKVIYDVLNSLEVPVIIATHSPALVDMAEPERVFVVSRGDDGGTVVEPPYGDLERLKRRLSELGVSLSDYVLYSRTWGQEGRAE